MLSDFNMVIQIMTRSNFLWARSEMRKTSIHGVNMFIEYLCIFLYVFMFHFFHCFVLSCNTFCRKIIQDFSLSVNYVNFCVFSNFCVVIFSVLLWIFVTRWSSDPIKLNQNPSFFTRWIAWKVGVRKYIPV